MGSGIGMWLLYRAGDGNLALSSLVVPPGAATPVHDHLAWGLVGLYRGTQDEVVFTRTDDASVEDHATLEKMTRHSLKPGDLYALLPETDIHQVRTTSDVTSVSLHLLGNDNGCIMRHRFHPEEGRVEPFKSGWLNVPCADAARRKIRREWGKCLQSPDRLPISTCRPSQSARPGRIARRHASATG